MDRKRFLKFLFSWQFKGARMKEIGAYRTQIDWAKERVICIGTYGTKIMQISEVIKLMKEKK